VIFSFSLDSPYGFRPDNEGISDASFYPDMLYNFYLMKNHKIANKSATTEAREKISTYLESLEF
jgi:hypothetical protein